jgi:adenine deaminase
MGLRRGALASSVGHDHHNLMLVGADDDAMRRAARRVAELGGGFVVDDGERIVAELPLPIAGLVSATRRWSGSWPISAPSTPPCGRWAAAARTPS